ncbi:hypothetical protein EL565_24180 [Escherichia coli]|nr:hypothetical protein [Escherichia coli]HAG7937474.1 hypothetical protein [Escherichia coli]
MVALSCAYRLTMLQIL